MKILIIAPINSPIVRRLALELEAAGIEIVIASHNAERYPSVINLGPVKSMLTYFNIFKVRQLVKVHNPDVVHAHILNHYGLMSIFQPKPLVVALWGSDVMVAPKTGSYLRRLFYRLINSVVLYKSASCHTSGKHVAIEASRQCSSVKNKTEVFYWGFPLPKPVDKKVITERLASEFGLLEDNCITFARGLGDVYNPTIAAKLINKLILSKVKHKIVVLRAFASDLDVLTFKNMVDLSKVIFIDRLLDQEELYVLYEKSCIHVSIPKSDSLGGGVIEPALLGSLPILSNIPSYCNYVKDNNGIILKDFTESSLNKLVDTVIKGDFVNSDINIPLGEYKSQNIVNNIVNIYSSTMQSENQ